MTADEAETRLIEILRFYKAETLCGYVEMERELKGLLAILFDIIKENG